MRMVFDADIGERKIHGEKEIFEDGMRDPTFLGLAIISFTSDARDKIIEQLKKLGYEVDDFR